MINVTAKRLLLSLIHYSSIIHITMVGIASVLGLLLLLSLSLVASSDSIQQIRNGVVVNDDQTPASAKTARIYIPMRAESGLSLQSVSTSVIDFDHDASGNPPFGPCVFRDTSPLTELYASLGVHFSGPTANSGGAILNQCGNFGVPALSGENFLAFNRNSQFLSGGVPTDPEAITFDSPTPTVSLFASAGFVSGTFKLEAFDASNNLVSTDIQTAPTASYVQLQVSSTAKIKKVVLTRTDSTTAFDAIFFVVEDMTFSLPFDICLQDDSNRNLLQFNTTTGDYQFTNCHGFTISGAATLTQRGSTITLQHNASDRRVMARIDTGINKAMASIQVLGQGTTYTIRDSDTSNNV